MLFDINFDLQKNMELDGKKSIGKESVLYLSDIFADPDTNYAVCGNLNDIPVIEEYFVSLKKNPCFCIADDDSEAAGMINALLERGYKKKFSYYWMRYGNKSGAEPDKRCRIEVADTPEKADIFRDIFVDAYSKKTADNIYFGSFSRDWIRAVDRAMDDKSGKFSHLICFHGDIPVSALTFSFSSKRGGIYNLGTRSEFRNMGYGRAVLNSAVNRWFELDGEILFLQCTTRYLEKWYMKAGFDTLFFSEGYVLELFLFEICEYRRL